uniref:Immunoglobulin V-set domain-containing protein n=1 Tax=Oryzias sinensis TaxID=183150 RepID=A0A8C7WUT5_9TELE
LLIHLFLCMFCSSSECKGEDKEESTLEGTSVTLSYKYKNAAKVNDYFFWYQQFPGKPPEFLISHTGTGTPISQPVPGFSFKVSDNKRQMDLQISSAAVTDSAVYYCAVEPTVTGNNKTLYKNLADHFLWIECFLEDFCCWCCTNLGKCQIFWSNPTDEF